MRCVHEASLYSENCFVTLTYDNRHLPGNGSLDRRELQLFLKRLRKRYGQGLRYYGCGEYGEKFDRPHYHLCLFNHDFEDKVLWKIKDGVRLYTSAQLATVWELGFSTVGAVTFESAAYVARYCMKKITGPGSGAHYGARVPEFPAMSRGSKKLGTGGIGKGWLEEFQSDVYPNDYVIMRGHKLRPPRYYDNIYDVNDPKGAAKLRGRRVRNAREHEDNNTPERLRVRETVQEAKLKQLVRNLDKE